MSARQKDSKTKISRRAFMGATASTAFAFSVVPGRVLGKDAPSNKLNLACIGVGHQGWANLRRMQSENVVALCDVDMDRAGGAIRNCPGAKVYRDFRVMFDDDAVVVATPDHTHYVAAMAAIERGKHVYCEKPLAQTIYEVRKLTEAARKHKVVTQLGIQGHSSEHIRLCCEWIWDGAIGPVREVRAWSNRPQRGYAFPSSLARPEETPAVPDTLKWDLWLGPRQYRPYHPVYLPVFWRGWLDFGTGALGDMGSHILDPAFWALRLDKARTVNVEASTSYNPDMAFWNKWVGKGKKWKTEIEKCVEEQKKETYPSASILRYEFGARGDMPPVELSWHDGGLLPKRPKEASRGFGNNGAFIVGEQGAISYGTHGAKGARINPESRMQEYAKHLPPKTIKRVQQTENPHRQDWLRACKGGDPASANFDYGGPLTELLLIGIIASRVPGEKLTFDFEKMEFTNSNKHGKKANELIRPVYREGWKL